MTVSSICLLVSTSGPHLPSSDAVELLSDDTIELCPEMVDIRRDQRPHEMAEVGLITHSEKEQGMLVGKGGEPSDELSLLIHRRREKCGPFVPGANERPQDLGSIIPQIVQPLLPAFGRVQR